MESVALAARLLLAVVFTTAAVAKLADQRGLRRTLGDFGVPARSLAVAAVLLPLAELATVLALLSERTARWGGVAALVLLAVFSAGVIAALARGRRPDCHCFGRLSSGPAGRATLIRNALLAVPAALVVGYGPGASIGTWVDARSPAELAAVAAGIAALALAVLCARLWLENRRLRRNLTTLGQEFETPPMGLPVGSPAPRFALESVGGPTTTLDALLERDKPVALVFLSTNCGTCAGLLPSLARWQATLTDRLTIAPVEAGSASEVRRLAERHGLENVLVQNDVEVFRAYGVLGTPSGVIVAADGSIASPTTATVFMVESLLRRALHDAATTPGDGAPTPDGARLVVQQFGDPVGAR